LGKTLFTIRPEAKSIFMDFSEAMIKAAVKNCKEYKGQATFNPGYRKR